MPTAQRPLLALFARLPEPGRVKTRLAEDIGYQLAADLYSAFTEDLVDRLSQGPWKLAVAADPEGSLKDYRLWLPQAETLWSQGSGDLGARLERIVRKAFQAGYGPVVLLGSDMPHLPGSWVERAIAYVQQRQADVVVGPASDGGYYLMCLSRPWPLFSNIEWSSERVLSQTLALTLKLELRTVLLPVDSDVDTVAEWQDLAMRVHSGEIEDKLLPRTAWWAERWLDR